MVDHVTENTEQPRTPGRRYFAYSDKKTGDVLIVELRDVGKAPHYDEMLFVISALPAQGRVHAIASLSPALKTKKDELMAGLSKLEQEKALDGRLWRQGDDEIQLKFGASANPGNFRQEIANMLTGLDFVMSQERPVKDNFVMPVISSGRPSEPPSEEVTLTDSGSTWRERIQHVRDGGYHRTDADDKKHPSR